MSKLILAFNSYLLINNLKIYFGLTKGGSVPWYKNSVLIAHCFIFLYLMSPSPCQRYSEINAYWNEYISSIVFVEISAAH